MPGRTLSFYRSATTSHTRFVSSSSFYHASYLPPNVASRTSASPSVVTRHFSSPANNQNNSFSHSSRPRWLYHTIALGLGFASGAFLFQTSQGATEPRGCISDETTKTLSDRITERLNLESHTYLTESNPVTACHLTRIASNSPCEDFYARGQFQSTEGLLKQPWHGWAVYDGHAGSQTAALLTKVLFPAVEDALSHLPQGSTDEVVKNTIRKAFVALDDEIVEGAAKTAESEASYHERIAKLMPAYSGSCALVSFLDPATWTLRVACVGDSRAVLGSQGENGTWNATALSVDQTGSNEEEISRINAEHPGETNIAKDGRILGIMVSRGFGDGRWKWDLQTQEEIKKKFDGFNPLAPGKYAIKTPPYLTADPVVTTTQLDEKNSSFLIMASDGFWDRVSDKQAVELVSRWLDSHGTDDKLIKAPSALPNDHQVQHEPFQLEKHRQGEPGFLFSQERQVLQDDNAAVHLARNALGGSFEDMVAANLLVDPPFSRYARDDITIQVIFFDPKKRSA